MVAMRNEFAILIDGEVGHIIGRQARLWIKCSLKRICSEADVMGRTTCVNDGAFTIWKGLVKAEACKTIGQRDNGCRQEAPGRAARVEAVPLCEHTREEKHNKGSMEDKGRKRSPGILVGIEIDDG